MTCNINNSYEIDKFKCDRNDDIFCNITKNNSFYQQFLMYLNRLNCYIFDKNINYSKYKNIIDILYNYLHKRQNYIKDLYLWKQLHSRYVDTYEIDNYNLKIGNINIYRTTKHNYAVAPFINEMLNNNKIDLLVHFDTHSDMNTLDKYNDINKIFDDIISKNDVHSNINNLEKVIWDIGMPVTGFIAFWNKINKNNDINNNNKNNNDINNNNINNNDINNNNINNNDINNNNINNNNINNNNINNNNINNKLKILWTVPAWIPILTKEPIENETDSLFSSKNIFIKQDKKENSLTYSMNKTNNTISSFHFKRLKFKNKTNWEQVLNYIDNSTFILDIDLDYFVANGIKKNKSKYLEDYDDIASHYRVTTNNKIFNVTPRDPFYENSEFSKYENDIKKEINEIKKRIKYFFKGIKYLKQKGKIPVSIIICDSTSAPASIYTKYHTHYNEYVPHEYALWIHKTILSGLNKIYLN